MTAAGTRRVYDALAKVLGPQKADEVLRRCREDLGLEEPSTPAEMLAFGERLAKEGGFVEVVGRWLKVQALLAGARVDGKPG